MQTPEPDGAKSCYLNSGISWIGSGHAHGDPIVDTWTVDSVAISNSVPSLHPQHQIAGCDLGAAFH